MVDFKPDKLTIHVVSPERAVNYKWENEWKKVSPEIDLMSVDDLNSLPVPIRNEYFDVPSFQEGMILILDKVNNRYYPAVNAADVIPKNKDNAIDKIASLLGAKLIKRKVINTSLEKRELSVDGKIKVGGYKGSAEYKKSQQKRIENRYNGVKEFAGHRTREGYLQAVEFCKKTGLIFDPSIRRMLEDRDPDHPNPLLRECYNVVLTNEVDRALEAAFSLSWLTCFSVSTNIKEAISTSQSTELSLEIVYG